MDVTRYGSVGAFSAAASARLYDHETENNLLLGISHWLETHTDPSEPPYLATISEGGDIQGAALRTPGNDLILSHALPERALIALIDDLRRDGSDPPGVIGTKSVADLFAEHWSGRTGSEAQLFRSERILRAESIVSPTGVNGVARGAEDSDRGLLVQWLDAFGREIGESVPVERVESSVDTYLSGAPYELLLWTVDGAPVSIAGMSGPTRNGIRVNAVYTPPEHRNNGYAGACVARLGSRALAAGRRYCFIFTDATNPTSNKIYMTIGFEPIADVSHYRFTTRA